jgi:hypothetical protein
MNILQCTYITTSRKVNLAKHYRKKTNNSNSTSLKYGDNSYSRSGLRGECHKDLGSETNRSPQTKRSNSHQEIDSQEREREREGKREGKRKRDKYCHWSRTNKYAPSYSLALVENYSQTLSGLHCLTPIFLIGTTKSGEVYALSISLLTNPSVPAERAVPVFLHVEFPCKVHIGDVPSEISLTVVTGDYIYYSSAKPSL